MHTLEGDIPESELTKRILEETVPCGKSITTTWFNKAGKLVRQDVEIQVTEGIPIGGQVGKFV